MEQYYNSLTQTQIIALGVAVVWDMVWKLVASWTAAQKKDKFAFVALLLINSIGVVPIAYLAYQKYGKKA